MKSCENMRIPVDPACRIHYTPIVDKSFAIGGIMEVIYSSVKDIERLYKGLADESRMKIVFLLDELGEACVRDIQQVLKVPQPTVSRHLGLLKRMGLVDNHRRGKWNYYYVVKKQPDVVKQLIHGLTNLDSCRKIFRQELQSQMDKLLPRPKVRR